ncbi:hypothetical protein ANN_06550 [Periplaneta americana]|uniref:Uncharacterized protein n=1 Tax=Periplaneta americana TaxID=6978 RepID=A0ABQ8TFM1_PERAM|nr:hypothetical protein ANN_06550 [Periplaneta americana]
MRKPGCVATRIMKFLIDNFGVSNLFGRENYEFYARITGRILKVEEDWIFSFRYPPDTLVSREYLPVMLQMAA